MELNLKCPLLFFDIESTGLDISKDRIIEISAVKVHPDGKEELKTKRINPGNDQYGNPIQINPDAQKVHGISLEDLKDCPTFNQIAKSFYNWMEGCDIAGYNLMKFDIPLLVEELLRVSNDPKNSFHFDVDSFRKRKIIDVQNIFHKMEQRTLSAAYKFYCKKDLENAHSAEADTIATYEVLKSQLDRYPDTLKNDVNMLAEFSTRSKFVDYAGRIIINDKEENIINFGKYKGRKVEEVIEKEPSYYDWIQKGDFTLDTKQMFTKIKIGMLNKASK